MVHYVGWIAPNKVRGLRSWLFYIWNEYEPWHKGVELDGLRTLGFEFEYLVKVI